jgi:colanic acid biosynthesis glycosyl transferase WcaI
VRVLFINQYFPPDVSATSYLLAELTEDLARRHEIWVIAGRPSYNPTTGRQPPAGVHLVRTWSTSFSRASMAGRILNYTSFMLSSLVKIWSVPRPRVVVAFTDPPLVAILGLLATMRHGTRLVYVCADLYPDLAVALRRMKSEVSIVLWHGLNRLLRGRSERVVAVGRDMLAKLRAEGVPEEKSVFLPNWAETDVPDRREILSIRRTMGWHGRFIVMHAGNVGLAQNLRILIEAADYLREDPGILVVIVGDGAQKSPLQQEASRRRLTNVMFLPYMPKNDVQSVVAAAHIHVVSLVPGLRGCAVPSKIYGIMASGRPFVAAVDAGSEPAMVAEEHGCGIVIPPGDPRALADTVLRARDLPLDEMGRRGREAFESLYDRPIATEAYRRLLEDVASAH